MRSLGIDLGGTAIKLAVLDGGRIRSAAEAPTRAEEGPEAVLDRMAELGRRAIDDAGPVERVGVAAPGPLDVERGVSLFMPNLPGWRDTPIVAELEARLGLPVALINDGRAQTLAELLLGAGRGCATLACFALGTGVGGGIAVHGTVLLGMNGTVGELGHLTVEREGRPCACGSRGCLEQYASGTAIGREAGVATAAEAIEAARSGERGARAALERAGAMLGIGIANVALVVGPERVVVGGGVAAAGELLLAPARAELRRRNRMMPVERIELVAGALGPSAGAIGAALWAREAAAAP